MSDSRPLLTGVMLSVAVHLALLFLPGGAFFPPEPEERYFVEIGLVEAADFAPDRNPVRNLARVPPECTHQTSPAAQTSPATKKKVTSGDAVSPSADAPKASPPTKMATPDRLAEMKQQAGPEEPVVTERRMASTEDEPEVSESDRTSLSAVAELSAATAMTEPRPLSTGNPSPRYPRLALRRGWEGEVVLRVLVSSSGKVDQVRVLTSSGYDLLDDSAVEAVRAWRFQPARRGDAPVASDVRVPVRFRLQKS